MIYAKHKKKKILINNNFTLLGNDNSKRTKKGSDRTHGRSPY